MRDLIDERNRREKLKNSIIKGYNVHYVTQEELARQKEEEDLQKSIELHAAMAKMDAERHPHVECPYCHSTNTEKISTVSRAVSVSLVGAASSKLGKQWHCNNCGSNF